MQQHVVVGTDGSPTASRAVERAIGVAAALGATLHVVDVVVPPRVSAPVGAAGVDAMERRRHDQQQAASGALAHTEQLAAVAGVTVVPHLEQGDPAERIVAVADAVAADLVVVGSRGLDPGGRYALSSVPQQVLDRARCDVLVVRTTAAR